MVITAEKTIRITGFALGAWLVAGNMSGFPVTRINMAIMAMFIFLLSAFPLWRGERLTADWWLLGLVGAGALSLIVARPAPLAACWARLAAFAVALAALSPLVGGVLPRLARGAIWRGWLAGCAAITLLSFLLLVAAIATDDMPRYVCFGFRGLTRMGMMLSPLAAVTALVCLWRYLRADTMAIRAVWLAAMAASVVTMVAAGSRIAVAGMAAASALMMAVYGFRRGRWRRHAVALAMLAVIGGAAVAIPGISFSINTKMGYAADEGSLLHNRMERWQGRLAEFESSPLVGVGFAAQTVFNSRYDNPAAVLAGASPEPGSSWLSLMAQTGLLGTACFIGFWAAVFRRSRRSPLLWALLLFLAVNGTCEGWLLYAGATLFPLFWLLPGEMRECVMLN